MAGTRKIFLTQPAELSAELQALLDAAREQRMTPTADTPPQRFRWRANGIGRWHFGACVYAAAFEIWSINTFGHGDVIFFSTDPWEVMGQVIGDAAVFEWIDNDMGWRGLEGGK